MPPRLPQHITTAIRTLHEQGLGYKDIAAQLGIKPSSVSGYLSRRGLTHTVNQWTPQELQILLDRNRKAKQAHFIGDRLVHRYSTYPFYEEVHRLTGRSYASIHAKLTQLRNLGFIEYANDRRK